MQTTHLRLPLAATVAAAVTALTLAGCAIGPDYERPSMPLPERYNEANGLKTGAASTVPAEWWKLFGDSTLNGLIDTALKNNADLLLAVARLEESEAAAREAGAALYPRIDAGVSATHSRISQQTSSYQPGAPIYINSNKAALSTSFELDLWGKLRRGSEAARASALGSQFSRETVRLTLLGQVTQYYLALRAADAQTAVTKQTIDSRKASLKITQSRQQAGIASPLDVQQAEGSLAAAEAQLASLKQQRAVAEHQLGYLLAQPGFTLSEGDLRSMPLPPAIPADLPSTLLEKRPDVRQAEQDLIAANARIGVAKAAYFPSISLTGSLGNESRDLSNLFKSNASLWSLGVGLTQPIFDAGGIAARYDQATARQQQALLSYQKAVHNAFREVNDALSNLRNMADAESAQHKREQAAAASLKLTESRYRAGFVAYLQVLDAQRTLYDAQQSAISTRQTRLQALVDLFKAMGGGWQGSNSNNTLAEAKP
jgi:multidrug efflux system outer membrane protein